MLTFTVGGDTKVWVSRGGEIFVELGSLPVLGRVLEEMGLRKVDADSGDLYVMECSDVEKVVEKATLLALELQCEFVSRKEEESGSYVFGM